jgi:hypothetical protein
MSLLSLQEVDGCHSKQSFSKMRTIFGPASWVGTTYPIVHSDVVTIDEDTRRVAKVSMWLDQDTGEFQKSLVLTGNLSQGDIEELRKSNKADAFMKLDGHDAGVGNYRPGSEWSLGRNFKAEKMSTVDGNDENSLSPHEEAALAKMKQALPRLAKMTPSAITKVKLDFGGHPDNEEAAKAALKQAPKLFKPEEILERFNSLLEATREDMLKKQRERLKIENEEKKGEIMDENAGDEVEIKEERNDGDVKFP